MMTFVRILTFSLVVLLTACSGPGANYQVELAGTATDVNGSYVVYTSDGSLAASGALTGTLPIMASFIAGRTNSVHVSGTINSTGNMTATILKDGKVCKQIGPISGAGTNFTLSCP